MPGCHQLPQSVAPVPKIQKGETIRSRTPWYLLIPLFSLISGALCWATDPLWVRDETRARLPSRLGGIHLEARTDMGSKNLAFRSATKGRTCLRQMSMLRHGIKAIPDEIIQASSENRFESVAQDVFAGPAAEFVRQVVRDRRRRRAAGDCQDGLRALYKCFEYYQNPSSGLVCSTRSASPPSLNRLSEPFPEDPV